MAFQSHSTSFRVNGTVYVDLQVQQGLSLCTWALELAMAGRDLCPAICMPPKGRSPCLRRLAEAVLSCMLSQRRLEYGEEAPCTEHARPWLSQ